MPHRIRYLVTACSYLFLYLQPNLIQNSLRQITCSRLAGRYWKQSNLVLECLPENRRISQGIAISILLFEILLPLALLAVLVNRFKKSRVRSFDEVSLFTKNFGYIFLGYSVRCYYWEFVRIAQKVAIIAVIITFNDQELLKGLFTLFFIILYGLLTYNLQPSDNVRVQRLDLLGTYIQSLAILLSLTTIDSEYDSMAILAIVMSLLLACFFLLYVVIRLWKYYFVSFMLAIYHRRPSWGKKWVM